MWPIEISIVIPVKDEVESIPHLAAEDGSLRDRLGGAVGG